MFEKYREIIGDNSNKDSNYPTPKELNEFFTSIGSQLAKNFENQSNFDVSNIQKETQSMFFKKSSSKEVMDIIASLKDKTSTGLIK